MEEELPRRAYTDEILDGGVFDERLAAWSERLTDPGPADDTVVAADGGSIVGFVHTVLDHDPVWGALLDNLHVAHARRGGGIGRRLLEQSASAVLTRGLRRRLYLWVLDSKHRLRRSTALSVASVWGAGPQSHRAAGPPSVSGTRGQTRPRCYRRHRAGWGQCGELDIAAG
ncbi:MAG: GNAT family N-acetyltransferase [Acidimicrobiales bacterium]